MIPNGIPPAGPQRSVLEVAERLRRAQGLTHSAFVLAIGRPKSEWHNLRAGRRPPSPTFVRALTTYAGAIGGGWLERLEAAVIQDALARLREGQDGRDGQEPPHSSTQATAPRTARRRLRDEAAEAAAS